jgi:DUF4097 and DUF4098 domain-containing protein YvlB
MVKKTTILFFIFILSFAYINVCAADLKVLKEKTFQISPGKNLKVEASSGDVSVTSWDKNEVYIKILGNKNAEEKMKFDFYNDDDNIEVVAKGDHSIFGWFFNRIKLKFEIKVPINFNEKIKTSGGDVYSRNISGNLNISTSGGDINVENVNGIFDLSTSGGDISGMNFHGNLEASTSGGDINLKGSDSKIKASTSGGDVYLDYEGKNNGIELSTSGGDIQIKLPQDFDASAKMHTSGGDISCQLTANNAKKISSTRFEADLNKGGNPLYAETSGGDIEVRKK